MNNLAHRRAAIASFAVLLYFGCLRTNAQSAQESPALRKADAAFRAGFAAQQAGNLELARAQFAEAVQLAPQIAEGYEALGTVLLHLGKPREATRSLETALKLQPKSSGNESNLALAYAAGRAMQALLAGVEPGDAPTFAAAAGLCLLMAASGSIAPALRALRVDPITVVRAE